MGRIRRQGCSLSPPTRKTNETGMERGRRKDTTAQKQARQAQTAGGHRGRVRVSSPRLAQIHRPAPHKPSDTTTQARGRDRSVEASEVMIRARRGEAARPTPPEPEQFRPPFLPWVLCQPGAVRASQAHKLGYVEGKGAEGDEEDAPTNAHTQHNESRVQAHTRAHTHAPKPTSTECS